MRRPLIAFLLVVLAVGAAGFAWMWARSGGGSAAPLPALPAEIDALEPSVAAAIRAAHADLRAERADAARWGRLGLVHEANGLAAAALPCYAEAARLAPEKLLWRFREALCLSVLGRGEDALAALRAAIAIDPGFAPARARLGEWLLERGELAEARAALSEAVRLAPEDADAWAGLARAFLAADEPEPAILAARRALALRPDERYLHHVLGSALRDAGRAEEAAPHLAHGRGAQRGAADPFAAELARHRSRAAALFDELRRHAAAGRDGDMIPLLREILRKDPDSLYALNRLALALGAAGRAAEGIPLLERALELEPENVRSLVNLAVVHEMAGEPQAALDALERAIALDPALARAHELKGSVLRARGRSAEAILSFRRAAELDERSPRLWIWIGELELDRAEWGAAAASLQRAIALDPQSGEALALLAVAWMQLGLEDEARATFARAESLAPSGSPVLAAARAVLAGRGKGPK